MWISAVQQSDWVIVVQSLSRVWLFETPGTAARQASLSFTILQSLLKLMCIESVMPPNHLVLCRLLLSYTCMYGGLFAESCLTLVTLWTVARQVPLSVEFSRQEYLKWVAVSFSRGSSRPRNRTQVSRFAGKFFTGSSVSGIYVYVYITHTHLFFFIFFSIMVYPGILNIVPSAVQ